MAILHIKKKNTYSIIDNVIVNKTYKNLSFELVIYEDQSKEVELERKQYNASANIICKQVSFLFNGNGDLKEFEKYLKESYTDKIPIDEKEIFFSNFTSFLCIFNYENVITPCNIIFHYDKFNDNIIINYEQDYSHTYYVYEHNQTYYRYSDDRKNFSIDPISGIGTDHYFNANIMPYIQDQKNIIELCYKILKVIDKELLLYTVDV